MAEKPLHFLIIEARFYDDLADALLAGAKAALDAAGATFDVVTVPGALEIPAALSHGAERPPPLRRLRRARLRHSRRDRPTTTPSPTNPPAA